MLILSRRIGESLYLGDNIRITVLGIKGKQVKIGLDVPDDMIIYREEVYQRVMAENKLALETCTQDLLVMADIWKLNNKLK